MIANGILHATNSTGTGNLNLLNVTGWPNVRAVWGTTGNRRVQYAIIDTLGVPRASGYGDVDLSVDPAVLTRTSPLHSWDGTTYNDKTPTTVDVQAGWQVIVAPLANMTMQAVPPGVRATTASSSGMIAMHNYAASGAFPPTNGTLYVFSAYWPHSEPFNRVALRFFAANTGGSGYYTGFGIYEAQSGTGGSVIDGRALAIFDTWATTTPVNSTALQFSNTLSAPVSLVPGFYLFAFLSTWTGGTGGPNQVAVGQPVFASGLFESLTSGARRNFFYSEATGATALGATLPVSTNPATVTFGMPLFLLDRV